MELMHGDLTEQIIGAAIEVHRHLGPGLLESAYQTCLAQEMKQRAIPFQRELPVSVQYKGITVEAGYRLDFLIDNKVIAEVKAVEQLAPVHEAQLLTYLRLTQVKT